MKYSHILKEFKAAGALVVLALAFSPLVQVSIVLADEETSSEATTEISESSVQSNFKKHGNNNNSHHDDNDDNGRNCEHSTHHTNEHSEESNEHSNHHCDDENNEGNENEGETSTTTPPVTYTGSLSFLKFLCPAGTVLVEANGPDASGNFVKPEVCVPEVGVIFGYIHEDKTDLTSPYPGKDDPSLFTILGTTDTNGALMVHNLPAVGRYDVAEVRADGSWATDEGVLRLFCTGDSINPDNYETTFVPANGTAYCVGYNAGLVIGTSTENGTGTTTENTGTSTPPTNGTTTPPTTGGVGGNTLPDSTGGTGGSISVGGGTGFGGGTGGSVLGASTSCGIYLENYIKYGANNSFSDVIKLQYFLNTYEKAGLTYTGVYDQATYNAVNAFQVKHYIEVLRPWVPFGLPTETTPTGYVYKTTRRHINNTVCPSLNLPIPPLP